MTWNQKNMKDLCETCLHYWCDYPIQIKEIQMYDHPLLREQYYPHCEIVDKKFGFNQMKEHISYPCVKCPFNAYQKK